MSNLKILFPILVLSLTLCGTLAFQMVEIVNQKNIYTQTIEQQEKPLAAGKTIQDQLDALALGTLKLAQQGNRNAQTVVAQLKKLGITINESPNPSAEQK